MVLAEEDDAVNHARRRVRILFARHQRVHPQVTDARELGGLEARSRDDVGEEGERRGEVVLQHGERDEARVGVGVGADARAQVVERARQIDRAELARALVEHSRRHVRQPGLAFGSLEAPLGIVRSQDTIGAWWRSRSHTVIPFVALKTAGVGGRNVEGGGVSGRGPRGSGGGACGAATLAEGVGATGGAAGGGGFSAQPPSAVAAPRVTRRSA